MKQNYKCFILLVFLLIGSISSYAQNWQLVWSDEFTNGISGDWVFETGGGGWGNSELEYYRQENASVQNGKLVLTAKRENYGGMNYTSVRMKTQGRKSWKYGKIEASIAMPSFQGVWPAFWMLGDDISSVGWPKCGEIDIMEHINTGNNDHGTIHWADAGGAHVQFTNATDVNNITAYHTYTVIWNESSITWLVDGVQYSQANIANNINNTGAFHNNFFILLNMAIGGNWPGFSVDNNAFPANMYVDYVRVYQDNGVVPSTGLVTVYKDCNYGGFSGGLSVGDYTTSQLNAIGVLDNDVSSLRVTQGYKAILYDGDNFTGASTVITADNSCIGTWNDRPSSIQIRPNGDPNKAGSYFLQNRNSGLFMDVTGGLTGLGDGVNIQQWVSNGQANQQFQFNHLGDGAYEIVATHSNKVMDVSAISTANGANVQQWTYYGTPNQQFILFPTGDGYYKLIPKHSGKVVEVAGASPSGGANVQQWDNNNQTCGQWKLIAPVPVNGNGDGLTVNYFNGMNFETMKTSGKDGTINFDWGNGSPNSSVNADQFSARWTGQVQPRYSGIYTFYINSDNGRRVWIDNQLIIDKWIDDWNVVYTGTITLTAGQKYDIKVEYFENNGGASCKLEWSSPLQGREAIPQSQLYSNPLPSVSITSPIANSTLYAPATITIAANASDNVSVSQVDFYNGSTFLGSDNSAPYSYTWSNIAQGTYSLIAVATDNKGAMQASSPVTVNVATVQSGNGDGLTGNYFNGMNFETPVYSRKDASVNFDWGLGSPNSSVHSDAFSVRWTGQIQPRFSESYTFYLNTDNGRRLWINNQLVVDKWIDDWNIEYTGTITLTAGKKYDIRLEYFEDYGGASCKMEWSSASQAREVVPQSQLYSNGLPSVAITSPSNNSVFINPASINIAANTSDADGSISKVDFYNGSTLLGSASAAPFSYSINSPAVGTYAITAIATDNRGGVTVSSPANFIVKSDSVNLAPAIAITSPANNAGFKSPATITISADAKDSDGTVSKVEFFSGSTSLGSVTSSPYNVTWNNVAVGTYTITAKATDNSGASTTSASITVTVKANQAPTVTITSPANNTSYNAPATITFSADAKDADGTLSKVEFFNGSTSIGSVASSPFNVTWNNVAAGTYTITAKATDNSGAITTSSAITVTVKPVATNLCSGLPQYTENGGYVDGSKVQNAGSSYQCKPYPYTGWCNGAAWAYAPGTGAYWTDAWTLIGSCTPVAAPAAAPTVAPVAATSVVFSPNPATDVLNLYFDYAVKATIYDSYGHVAVSERVVEANGSIDISGISSGIYSIKIDTGSDLIMKSFVKN